MSNVKKTEQNDLTPQRTVELSDTEKVKAYVHPVRMTILGLLAKEKRTVSNVAKELAVHPANITHHFKLLEKTGLIRLVEKRDIGKTIEKYYRASAFNYAVNLEKESASGKKALALSMLSDDLSAAAGHIRDGDNRPVIALLKNARLTAADAVRFTNKLRKLVDDFAERDSDEGTSFNISVSLYPNDSPATCQNEIVIK